MGRLLRILLVAPIALAMLMGPALAAPADAVRPCVYVQVQSTWVRQCSPIEFQEMWCWNYTGQGERPTPYYVEVEACHPWQDII